MSRLLVVLLMCIVTVTLTKPTTNDRKPNELVRTCGTPLFQRVLQLCGGQCYGDDELSMANLACNTGVTDDQLVVLCCPQQ